MTNHRFKCLKCNLEFSIDSEQADIKKLAKELIIRCPKCQNKWGEKGAKIEYQMLFVDLTTKTEQRLRAMRKDNIEQSYMAKKAAMEYRQEHPEEFQQVAVQPPRGDRDKSLLPVNKNVLETIKQKVDARIEQLT